MQTMSEHLRGDTLAEAKAEAQRDIEHMRDHGWHFTNIRSGKDGSGYFVDVTYQKEDRE